VPFTFSSINKLFKEIKKLAKAARKSKVTEKFISKLAKQNKVSIFS